VKVEYVIQIASWFRDSVTWHPVRSDLFGRSMQFTDEAEARAAPRSSTWTEPTSL
jgi:hypothetical protein